MNYTVIEKEFLAAAFTFEKFRPYLIGSHVNIFTNRAILKYLVPKRDAKQPKARL